MSHNKCINKIERNTFFSCKHIIEIKQMNLFKKSKDVIGYLYKSIQRDWVVTMEILPDTVFAKVYTTATDDDMHREHLINKTKIVKIEHKLSNMTKNTLDTFYFQSRLGQKSPPIAVGQIICDSNFNADKSYHADHKIAGGITVYKSYEGAFYSEIPLYFDGDWYGFRRNNGILQSVCKMRNGQKHGKYITYQQDGISIETETQYENGYETGDRLTYFGDVLIRFETMVKGKRDGLVMYFKYPSGEIASKCIYQNNQLTERIT